LDDADQIKRGSGLRQEKQYFLKRAQALIELTVFGSILIFILAVIISQGVDAAIANSRNARLMREALALSYHGGYGNISPSFVVVEDRIAPGVTKYGEIDRQAFMFSGNGTLSYWMYYTPDADEKAATQYTTLFVNGRRFNIPTTRQQDATVSSSRGLAGRGSSDSTEIEERLTRENGAFCVKEYNNQDNEKYCHHIGEILPKGTVDGKEFVCTRDVMVQRFNLERKAGVTDLPDGFSNLSWQWRCETPDTVYKEVNKDKGVFPAYDFNGDLVEESIYSMKREDTGASTDPAASRDYVIRSVAQGAGGENPMCVSSGFLPTMAIYTNNGVSAADQNTYLKIYEEVIGADGERKRNVISSSGKKQVDLIERQYQLPRGVNFRGAPSCSSLGRKIACDEVVPSTSLCCFQGSMKTQTCFDTSSSILYIRSNLQDARGTSWFGQKVNK